MNLKKLIIYDFNELFKILYEIKKELNYEIIEISGENPLNISLNKKDDHLVIVKKLVKNLNNQILITSLPIKLSKLIEKLNIEFLKKNFHNQSELKIKKYNLDINSRELIFKEKKIKLTEKESNIILYISNSTKPVSIEDLQLNVWGYHSDLETHTVETHIYRLRKKILATFDDSDFIKSKKNGYQIN
ncbi:winged helix-turn-helix domain-containing protein [Candidatus Pelagibacter sp.]|jgi:DNA-binding response OmpR family regulator|nr:winged helix-turn-helix domain-containing protein [Candidatus Pelagibacter sp.]